MADLSVAPLNPQGFVARQVRRANRNLLLWNAAGLMGVALFAWATGNYYRNFFRGPAPTDDAGLLALAAEPGSGLIRYVELRDRTLIPTGFREVSTSDGREYSRIPYALVPVRDRFLLVMAKDHADGRRLVGPVYRVPEDVGREVVAKLPDRLPATRGRVLPVMMNAEAAFNVAGYVGLAIFGPFALLLRSGFRT